MTELPGVADRVAFVTGAAQGLGEAIARQLHSLGARLALADINEEAVVAVATALDPSGRTAIGLPLDVRSRDQFEQAVNAAEKALGGIDIVVNNAARTVSCSIWDVASAEWDDVLAVNLRGVMFGCQLVGPRLRDRAWGRIVNMASIAGQQGGTVAGVHYAASKAGIVVLTKVVARELAGTGVTCNAVAPAAIRGPAMDSMPAKETQNLAGRIPVGRVGEPAEVAALVAFLCSDHAGYITGATYDVNGGLSMR